MLFYIFSLKTFDKFHKIIQTCSIGVNEFLLWQVDDRVCRNFPILSNHNRISTLSDHGNPLVGPGCFRQLRDLDCDLLHVISLKGEIFCVFSVF
ncbi:hypothetical protein Hanom_Chr14g01321351 [Helianthus anomalus]